MKNFTAIALALLALPSLAPSSAQAGVIIGAIAGDIGTGALIGGSIGAAAGGAVYFTQIHEPHSLGACGSRTTVQCFIDDAAELGIYAGLFSSVGGILSVDADLSTDALVGYFKNKYRFINSTEALTDLSQVIKGKFKQQVENSPGASGALIRLNQAEIESALASASISESELMLLVNDLK